MKYTIESIKTTSGTRKLPMTDEVKEVCLRMVRNRKKTKRELMIDGYGGFLYLDKNGKPMVELHWEKYMQHVRDKYNRKNLLQLPPITPHICRHTYCRNMAREGMNLRHTVSKGQSDIGVTLNVYTHLGLDDARAELQRLREIKKEVMKQKSSDELMVLKKAQSHHSLC